MVYNSSFYVAEFLTLVYITIPVSNVLFVLWGTTHLNYVPQEEMKCNRSQCRISQQLDIYSAVKNMISNP